MGVFFLLVAVVVRSALDDLHVAQLDVCAGCLWGYEAAKCNDRGHAECYRGEEAEDVLQPHERGVHVCED